MNRRAFLGSMIGGLAARAAVRTWPFRVFSFPSKIEFPTTLLAPGLKDWNETIPMTINGSIFNYGDYIRVNGEVMQITRIAYNQIFLARSMRRQYFGVELE